MKHEYFALGSDLDSTLGASTLQDCASFVREIVVSYLYSDALSLARQAFQNEMGLTRLRKKMGQLDEAVRSVESLCSDRAFGSSYLSLRRSLNSPSNRQELATNLASLGELLRESCVLGMEFGVAESE